VDLIERLDEELLLLGLGWREAASITNEASGGSWALTTRCQRAEDIRHPENIPVLPA